MSSFHQNIKSASGDIIPVLAFGTATVHWNKPCAPFILEALRAGFRHIDTAENYLNEASVGEALAQWEGKREELFITTKWGREPEDNCPTNPRAALMHSLKEMGISYVDLFLIHDPSYIRPYTITEGWKIMEELQREGLCKYIGVSNFGASDLRELSREWTVIPAVNQIEYQPYCRHDPRTLAIEKTCKELGIIVSPYSALSPLTTFRGGPLDSVVAQIAIDKGISDTQVLLSWAMQQSGGPVVTTSSKDWRIREMIITLAKEPLSSAEMQAITVAGEKAYHRIYEDSIRP